VSDTRTVCRICGRAAGEERIFTIDGKPVCTHCLFGDAEPVAIYPIGTVRRDTAPGAADAASTDELCRIELHPGQRPFLYALDEEPRITVVYFLHRSGPVKTVFTRGIDGKQVGVFASRTPDRTSRIAIQDVELIAVEDTTLHVRGLDALDGSPVLDIKLSIPPKTG
jgi:tRNA (Thr-GGU) A37 N-methylase